MKTRNGFVSNSSSSSFLVASNEDAGDIEISLTLKVRMRDLTECTITNKKELLEYYSDMGFESEEDILKEDYMTHDYKACLKAIKEGKKIHVVVVSNEGSPFEMALYDSGEGKLPSSPEYEIISR